MIRLVLAAAVLALSVLVAGCEGEIVPLAPTSRAALSAEQCRFDPGEDPCARTFAVPPEELAAFVSAATAITTFAGDARELALSVRAACEGIVVELGGTPPTETEVRAAVEEACTRAMELLKPAALLERTVTSPTPDTCTTRPVPVCLRAEDGSPLLHTFCPAGTLAVVTPDGTAHDAVRAARALERQGGALLSTKARLERVAQSASLVAQNVRGPAKACESTLVPMGQTAISEIQVSISAVSSLLTTTP